MTDFVQKFLLRNTKPLQYLFNEILRFEEVRDNKEEEENK